MYLQSMGRKPDLTKINYTLDMEEGPFDELLSAAEAAEIWGMDQSTIRKAIESGRMIPGRDCRKFGKQWVVTVEAMARVFSRTDAHNSGPWSTYMTSLRIAKKAAESPE